MPGAPARLDRLGPGRRARSTRSGKLEGSGASSTASSRSTISARARVPGSCALGDDGQAAPEGRGAADPGCRDGTPADGAPAAGSTWVTRPRPHIDRIASAWLIKRFLDPKATFGFADRADAAKKGIPFDVLGAEFGHHGEDCTFETLVKRFGVKDRRLRAIAEIVHEADLHDGEVCAGRGSGDRPRGDALVAATPDDHELLERA